MICACVALCHNHHLRQSRRTTQILEVLKFIMQMSVTSANICALLCYAQYYVIWSRQPTRRKKPWIFKRPSYFTSDIFL